MPTTTARLPGLPPFTPPAVAERLAQVKGKTYQAARSAGYTSPQAKKISVRTMHAARAVDPEALEAAKVYARIYRALYPERQKAAVNKYQGRRTQLRAPARRLANTAP